MPQKTSSDVTRRNFLKQTGYALAAGSAGIGLANPGFAGPAEKYNILMIVTDQERYLPPERLPPGYSLPGHRKLESRGVAFENHQVASCVCTPSRSVIYTGQHIQNNGMFDNTNFPWSNDLSTDIPTIGDLLRGQGYYTAYKGKWHLTDEFETANDLHMPKRLLGEEMQEYGFSDYFGIGDMIAHTEGGFLHDGVIAAMTKSWLRGRAMELGASNQPWFMAVNLINPHDVMYYNTDLPGEDPAQARLAMMHLNREPGTEQFRKRWGMKLPDSRAEPLTSNGRPAAHLDFADSRSALVGRVPNDDARWHRLNDYYLNCIQSVDQHVLTILNELDDLNIADNTIVIYTADHGELGGAHGISGKGATAYREQNNVPFIISHPDVPGNKRCKAVTSHLDIAPTLLGLAGGKQETQDDLPGKNVSELLRDPESAPFDAVRPGALYNYSMLGFLDRDFLMNIASFIKEGGNPKELPNKGWRPDLAKRGAIRSVFDGRYKLSRYFSPEQHHMPTTIESLFEVNDVELFDLHSDPSETNNLATDRRAHAELLIAMNQKLNLLIDSEVGDDVGQMLPGGADANWVLSEDIGTLRM